MTARDADGAPIFGGVSDPAQTSGPGLPRYTPAIVFSCPECFGDLQDEAFSYYCPACQRTYTFAEVATFETGTERD